MTYNTLFLNNFKYDYEDDTWYYYDYSFRVIVVYLAYHNVFRLYYGGYDKYLGEYEDEDLFSKAINDYNIKIIRLKKLKKLKLNKYKY